MGELESKEYYSEHLAKLYPGRFETYYTDHELITKFGLKIEMPAIKKDTNTNNYSLIIGDDNIIKLTTWKQYSNIIKNHKIYVYPRNNYMKKSKLTHENIHYLNAPIINVSASNIRKKILDDKTDDLKIDTKVLSYLINNNIEINI